MTREERMALRQRQERIDALVSQRGQREAIRYLRSKEPPPTKGTIRASLALFILLGAILIVFLSM